MSGVYAHAVTASETAREYPHRMMLPGGEMALLRSTSAGTVGGPPVATIVHGWLLRAAAYAVEGRFDLVPARSPRVPGGMEDAVPLDFSMARGDYDDVRAALRGLCRPRDVVLACIPAYAASGGRLLRMEWPGRGDPIPVELPPMQQR